VTWWTQAVLTDPNEEVGEAAPSRVPSNGDHGQRD
jgi:hypothetical protein